MKSLRFRISLIWIFYLIAGAVWASNLIRFVPTMLVVLGCYSAALALRYLFNPALLKQTRPMLKTWLMIPMTLLLICANHFLIDPIRHQILEAGILIVVAVTLIGEFIDDKKVWSSGVDAAAGKNLI